MIKAPNQRLNSKLMQCLGLDNMYADISQEEMLKSQVITYTRWLTDLDIVHRVC